MDGDDFDSDAMKRQSLSYGTSGILRNFGKVRDTAEMQARLLVTPSCGAATNCGWPYPLRLSMQAVVSATDLASTITENQECCQLSQLVCAPAL